MDELDVLIIDDELALAETTKDYFQVMGLNTDYVTNKFDFQQYFHKRKIKLILLDINLGSASGYDICREIRETSNIPILFISVRTDDFDKIIALGVGGDDFIEKPYSLSVLVAKVKATLRRCYQVENDLLKIDDIEIDIKSRMIKVNQIILDMTVKEYDLLLYLIRNRNKAIPKETLYDEIWGQNNMGELNTLTVHIRKIREKIEKDPSNPQYIKTIWGIGYKFEG